MAQSEVSNGPSVAELLEDPMRVTELAPGASRSLVVRLAALQAALTVALLPSPQQAKPSRDGDRFLNAGEVGTMIGKSRSWVEHNHAELPARRRVGGEALWLASEIGRWMVNRPRWDEAR